MRQALGGFGLLKGATYPFQALAVFRRRPHLWLYLIGPILINLVICIFLYVGLLMFGWQSLEDGMDNLTLWVENLIANLPKWLVFLEYLIIGAEYFLRFVLVVVLLVVVGFILTQFGVLLGSPWYGKLSEQLEKIRTGNLEVVEVGIVRDIGRAILFELKKLALMVMVGGFLFLLNFLLGLGTIFASLGGLALTTTIICLDFFDAPLERRRLRFRQKLKIVLQSFPASFGFSFVCLILISIPLLNLVTIPLCVAGGTLFFCDRILPKRLMVDS